MLIRIIILLVSLGYHLIYGNTFNSVLLLYFITIGSSISYYFSLGNMLDFKIWFVPLFTIINSLAILSEEYLMGGVKILPSYSPSLIITSLYIFNISVHLFNFKFSLNKDYEVYNFSITKVTLMLIVTYCYFIFDFIRLGGFSHLENYGVNQFDYSIFSLLTNLFTITWAIGVILIARNLKGLNLSLWFVLNMLFIIIVKVIVGYRYFIILGLIIVVVRVLQLYKVNKLIVIIVGFLLFLTHASFGIYRGGEEISINRVIFQLGLEFSIVSQINYLVFNEFEKLQFGFSFFSSFLNLIPGLRLIAADFIFMPALYFNNEMVVKSEDMGYGFSFLSELFMNFGVYGGLILGLFVNYINTFTYSKIGSIKNILFPFVIYLTIRIIRSDSIEFVKMFAYAYFILIYLKKKI